MENEFSNRISVKNIVLAGMFAAFLAVMSQVSLPMPTGVPITVQVFAVALVGVIPVSYTHLSGRFTRSRIWGEMC